MMVLVVQNLAANQLSSFCNNKILILCMFGFKTPTGIQAPETAAFGGFKF